MNCKNESVTSVKFGSSAGASNATELSASGASSPHSHRTPTETINDWTVYNDLRTLTFYKVV